MSRAEKQVVKEIVEVLQGRIAQWEAERGRIDVNRERYDRKEARYRILGDLIAAAESEIAAVSLRVSDVVELEIDVKNGAVR